MFRRNAPRSLVFVIAALLAACSGGGSAGSPAANVAPVTATASPTVAPSPAPTAAGQSASAVCGTTNVALGKVATASSEQNGALPARAAFDGDPTTRWSSAASDPQWLQVNLGGAQPICGVTIAWESAYATQFSIDVSNDGTTWTTLASTANGTGGTQTIALAGSGKYVRMFGTKRATTYGYSIYEMQVFAPVDRVVDQTGSYVDANPPVTGVVPSTANPPARLFHEFQANCAVSEAPRQDDPIVFFDKPGASHSHTFLGNTTTNAATTLASLQAGSTTCKAPRDRSGYWMPTMYEGTQTILPSGPQVIYYKSGIVDYTSVRPFPPGLRFVVGDPHALPAEFLAGSVEGWECGNSVNNADFPPSCIPGSDLNVRYQAPSCWDGLHLDSPDHKSHMSYPVSGRCTARYPVAVPMLEIKMAFPAGTDTSGVRLASGRGYSFHYDFFNAWDPPTLAALVNHCIVGGLQCDARGFDQTDPGAGAALNANYELP